MPIFQNTTTITASPDTIEAAIKETAETDEQVVTLVPKKLLIVLRQDLGFVYLLQEQAAGTTFMRVIVESSATVRATFRGRSRKEAVAALLKTPAVTDSQQVKRAAQAAQQRLTAIQDGIRPKEFSVSMPAETVKSDALFARSEGETAKGDSRRSQPLAASRHGGRRPWDPTHFMTIGYLASIIIAGPLFAWNWRRLGKPQRFWPTLLFTVVVPLMLIAGVFLAGSSKASTIIVLGLAICLAVVNWGGVVFLGSLQRDAYAQWGTASIPAAARTEQTSIRRALAQVAITLLIGGGLAIGMLYFNSQPNTFESADLTISYPSVWAKQATNDIDFCQSVNFECLIVLADARFGYTWITLGKFNLGEPLSPKQIETLAWENFQATTPAATRVAVESLEIDGLPAVSRYYRYPLDPPEEGTGYGMQIFIVDRMQAYELTAASLNEGIFRERRNDIDAFIAGINFKSNDA